MGVDVRRVWAVGPDNGTRGDAPTNVLVDCTHGLDNLHTIKEHVVAAFQELCREGPQAHLPLRGVVFELHDAKAHHDSAHRGAGQVRVDVDVKWCSCVSLSLSLSLRSCLCVLYVGVSYLVSRVCVCLSRCVFLGLPVSACLQLPSLVCVVS